MGDRAQLLNDNEEAQRLILDGRQVGIWTALPGIVQAVDFTKMVCEVQPAIQATIEDQNGILTAVNLPKLINVPIVFPSAGGFTFTLPLKINDEVLVIWACRCIDAWWQSGGFENQAMEARMHDLSDGFAIPGPKSLPHVLSGISTTGAQLRNDAGTTYVELSGDGKIKLVSPEGIFVTGNLVVSGEVTAGTVALKTHIHTGGTIAGDTGAPIP